MNIEHTEINGFQIDKFNQYGLEVGKTQGICPLCSNNRKEKNKKSKCASYDWQIAIGTCHHCNSTFQLHTYKRRSDSQKEYILPKNQEVEYIQSTKIEDWFQSRGISKETLKDLGVSEGKEYMPQVGMERNTIQFNYFMGDKKVNVKYRDAEKNFKLYKGAEKVFYNINSIVGYDSA